MAGPAYVERRPARRPRGSVSVLWTQSVDADAAPHAQRNVADGSAEVLCRIGEAPRIVGPKTMAGVELL